MVAQWLNCQYYFSSVAPDVFGAGTEVKAALELLITVVPDAKAEALLARLRPPLGASSGVMFVSETYVSRAEYFT